MFSFKLFEQTKSVKDLIHKKCLDNGYKILNIDEFDQCLDIKVEGIHYSYDELIKDLSFFLKNDLSEVYTEEVGKHFKIFLKCNEEINSKQTIFTKSYITDFLKRYGYTLNQYSPILKEMSILVKIKGDKSNYDKMLNRLLSLHYLEIEEVYTIKPGEELKLFIKNF